LVKRLQAITPVLIPTAEHWRIPEDREYYLEGLRLAVGQTLFTSKHDDTK
jgi:adenylate cyclase